MREVIAGRHAVLEALRAGRPVRRLLVADSADEKGLRELLDLARDQNVPVGRASPRHLDLEAEGARHQGVLAYVEEPLPVTIDDVLKLAETRGEPPFLCLLDGIEDPQNLGAVLRCADAAGVHGVVVPERGAAHLSPGVYKASAGAANVVPLVRVSSLANAIETLRRHEIYVVGADALAEKVMWQSNLRGPLAFVIGSESAGLSRLVGERCDERVRIPMRGKISSLNASVAASLLFFEKLRQEAAPQ